MVEMDIEKILDGSTKNNRIVSYARRQALKEGLNSTEVEELLEVNEKFVIEHARRFVAEDLREFYSQISEIRSKSNLKEKAEKIDNLLFDFQTRIPDVIELLVK